MNSNSDSKTCGFFSKSGLTAAVGNQIHQTTPSSKVVYTYDDAKRLAEIRSRDADRLQATAIEYDGRSFLKRAALSLIGDRPFESRVTTATYSSEGILHHKTYDERPTPWSLRGTPRVFGDDYVFYFAGRPVAQLGVEVTSGVEASRWLFLTTDHLGTPLLASGQNRIEWSGGFEPFGAAYGDASGNIVSLRLPGQWNDEIFLGAGIYYNVHRWYEFGTGRYTRRDPLGVELSQSSTFAYVSSHPTVLFDLLGLFSCNADGSVDPDGIPSTPAEGAAAWAQFQYEVENTDFTFDSDTLPDCGGAQKWKCNCFVKHALEEGGNVPYSKLPKHYQDGQKGPYFAQANDLANESLNGDVLGRGSGSVGDIVAWPAKTGSGHTGIVGCDGRIFSATRDEIAAWNNSTFLSLEQLLRYFGRREKVYRTCCDGN